MHHKQNGLTWRERRVRRLLFGEGGSGVPRFENAENVALNPLHAAVIAGNENLRSLMA